ncbi:serine protease [Planktothrix sp.]|uniref:S1 family peptidase n=3 Tax=unclassified Planktothrix TaxID=2648599 RepID=UPI0038D4FA17
MNCPIIRIGICLTALMILSEYHPVFAQFPEINYRLSDEQTVNLERLARLTTVRILTPNASGSGVIIQRQGQTYTVITNWHVLAFSQQQTVIAPDGQKYGLLAVKQLGNTDLAIAYFKSNTNYQIAAISPGAIAVGEPVFAAGFPMYQEHSFQTTFDQGLQVFRFTQGIISILPPKSLPQGYRLGYTNDIQVGMSGGPIFNRWGQLIGINGRLKNRDPDFGVYAFEDGTEPSQEMLELMVNSSWGIPIIPYWHNTLISQPVTAGSTIISDTH